MDRRSIAVASLALTLTLAMALPMGALAKGGKPPPHVDATNNLSFPAIAVDGYAITKLEAPSFVDIYDGLYPGLDPTQLALVEGKDMFAQKNPDGDALINKWQADYLVQPVGTSLDVDVIDWGDNIESVDAFVRRPYRLEVVLFKDLMPEAPLTGYTMALLEYPSSPDEIQGTDTDTYEGTSATVISSKPKLVIQALGDADPANLTWDVNSSRWLIGTAALPTTQIGFAPELNVAGKYIYGASTGGWKPTVAGVYRVTFYIPTDSNVNLGLAEIAVPAPEEEVTVEAEEGGGATPQLDTVNNLTYVDITVQPRNR